MVPEQPIGFLIQFPTKGFGKTPVQFRMWFTTISVLEKLPFRSECGSQQSPRPTGLPIFWVRERVPDLIGFLIRFPIVLNKVF